MTQVNEAGLGADALEVLKVVERFARDEVRPVGMQLDALADPDEVIAAGSPLWTLHDKYRALGVDSLSLAGSFEPAEQAMLSARITETLGWADGGLAVSLAVAGFPKFFIALTGDPKLTERYLSADSSEIGCWAITEPDHGSDSLAFSEPHWTRPEVRPNCIARLDGDEWVINGSKAAWVSNAPVATYAALFCTIDGDEGFAGGGVCITPLDLPGVSRGKNLNKLGQRALPQGELHFDDVRVPAANMVIGKPMYSMTVEMTLALANAFMGSTFAGLARAAYEAALEYAKDRVQGGVPIIQHQNVRSRLFKMFAKVEAAASLSRRTMLIGNAGPPPIHYSIASKTYCTTTAFEVASEALQIFGGNGLTKEYPIEKIMRDARAAMIEDGCNEMLSLVGGSKL
ncbi:MAG: acyl-CoA dehydrogenase [Microthrixaceae bacterium]|nr:acyl-CoA dehydrogenase [Microthrixaceae bacterium]